MATSDPIGTIDKEGKPGRPATVRRTAERCISSCIQLTLDSSGMVPCAMPKAQVRKVANKIAAQAIDELKTHGLHVIPASVAREFILLVGRQAFEPPTKDE